ncbi:MAG: uracil-DNA glycosylase [Acidimicrobiia bacterium]
MTRSWGHIELLDELAAIASVCTDCELSETRTNVVFGAGASDADVMIVGEGPGQQEDEQGLPFVGRSGQLLDKLLIEVGFERNHVYIGNVVKCRPPRNRDPRADEIDACKGYLRRQIELVDPKAVITLGNFSTKLLLNTETGITRMRGVAYEWWGRYLVPTFHPAAALRGGQRVTDDIRADLALVRQIVDGNLPGQQDTAVSEGTEASPAVEEEQLGMFNDR